MSPPSSPKRKAHKRADVTVKDVAARAGVSTATVSRTLSGQDAVSPELTRRVQQAAEELGYRPNQAARRLRARHSKVIGVLVPDLQLHFFASIVVKIDQVLQEAGYLLLLGNTNDNLASEQSRIDFLLGEGVSGVIFAAADSGDVSNYHRLQERGIPLVAVDRCPGDLQVDTVQVANQQATTDAVRHLIEEGHRQIGYIGGPHHISTAVERLAGYEQALAAARLPIDPGLIRSGGYTMAGGYQAMQALLESPTPPSAVLVANNAMALGAIQYINERGLDVPGQAALIAFDDMPWASALRPPLTAIAQPAEEIGLAAARLMLERIKEPKAPVKNIVLETRLVVRSSCRCGGGKREGWGARSEEELAAQLSGQSEARSLRGKLHWDGDLDDSQEEL